MSSEIKDYYSKAPEFGKKLYDLVKAYWNIVNADSIIGHLHQTSYLVAKRRFDFVEARRKKQEEERNGL